MSAKQESKVAEQPIEAPVETVTEVTDEKPAEKPAEKAGKKGEAKAKEEVWLLRSASLYRVNHPDGTVFDGINSYPHAADAWVRREIEKGLLIKMGVAE